MPKSDRSLILLVAAIVAVVAIGVTAGLAVVVKRTDHAPVKVTFIVPNGYRGVLKLRVKHDVDKTIKPVHGQYRFVFPSSGTLQLDGRLPVWNFKNLTVREHNGKTLPVADQTHVRPNAIAVRSMGAYSVNKNVASKEAWYIIGTQKAEAKAFANQYGQDYH